MDSAKPVEEPIVTPIPASKTKPLLSKPILISLIVLAIAFTTYYITRTKAVGTPQLTNQPINQSTVPVIAFIRDYNLTLSINGTEKTVTDDALIYAGAPYSYATTYYTHPSISPDGTKIAVFKSTFASAGNKISLVTVGADGTNLKTIIKDGDFDRTYPPQWMADSKTLILDLNRPVSGGDAHQLTRLDTGTLKQIEIITLDIQSGCGGGSSDPSDGLAGTEGAKNIYAMNFHLSPDNKFLTRSLNCTASGVILINMDTKEQKTLNEQITQVVFSPDSSLIAGINRTDIELYDTTGTLIKTLKTSQRPDAVYWGPDQTLYYTSAKLAQSLTAKDSLGNILEASQNLSSLWKINPDGTDSKLFETDAHNMRPIYVNSSRAYLALVENPVAYLSAVTNNQVDLTEALPQVNFITVDLSTQTVIDTTARVEQAVAYP